DRAGKLGCKARPVELRSNFGSLVQRSEESGIFALVRRQDRALAGPASILERICEPLRFAREARHRVGVEHDGTFPGERSQDASTRFLADAYAGPNRECVQPAIGEKSRQLLGAV